MKHEERGGGVGNGFDALRSRLTGALYLPDDEGYETSRTLWNAMIDRRPAAIVSAVDSSDVVNGIRFAKDNGLVLAVKGGGHNIAGNAVCDDGLTIDLSPMKAVSIDPARRVARVEPGVTLGEFDRKAQAHGLATPLGINSTTGVAGLTLGGGFGWLSRMYGLTADNLLSAEVVTADGKTLQASGKENPDLFWAIRGGGGNFGVVTSFEFGLHRVGPEVLAGLIVHPLSNAKQVLQGYRDLAPSMPDEFSCWVVLRKAPPLPFLPAEMHGKEVLVLALCYAGDPEEGKKAIQSVRSLATPAAEHVGSVPYADWQTAFDPLLEPGARNYWKSHDFLELPDGAIDLVLRYARSLPSPECEIFLAQLGGAVNRVAPDATAYPHRDVQFVMNVHTRWTDPAMDKKCITWARDFFGEAAPFATGGVYVNFMPEDETKRVRTGAYGLNYDRLARVKAKYDPENLFRMNHNIAPAQ